LEVEDDSFFNDLIKNNFLIHENDYENEYFNNLNENILKFEKFNKKNEFLDFNKNEKNHYLNINKNELIKDKIKIKSYDINNKNHVKLSSIFKWQQEIRINHWKSLFKNERYILLSTSCFPIQNIDYNSIVHLNIFLFIDSINNSSMKQIYQIVFLKI
jgi:hypothetical protein